MFFPSLGIARLICYKHVQSSCLLILYFRPQSHSLLTYALHRALNGWIASSEISHEFEKVWANPSAFVYIFALVTYAYHYLLKKYLNIKKATCKGIKHFHNARHLCKRLRTDGIKAMSRGILGGKQVIRFTNTWNRGRTNCSTQINQLFTLLNMICVYCDLFYGFTPMQ